MKTEYPGDDFRGSQEKFTRAGEIANNYKLSLKDVNAFIRESNHLSSGVVAEKMTSTFNISLSVAEEIISLLEQMEQHFIEAGLY